MLWLFIIIFIIHESHIGVCLHFYGKLNNIKSDTLNAKADFLFLKYYIYYGYLLL